MNYIYESACKREAYELGKKDFEGGVSVGCSPYFNLDTGEILHAEYHKLYLLGYYATIKEAKAKTHSQLATAIVVAMSSLGLIATLFFAIVYLH